MNKTVMEQTPVSKVAVATMSTGTIFSTDVGGTVYMKTPLGVVSLTSGEAYNANEFAPVRTSDVFRIARIMIYKE